MDEFGQVLLFLFVLFVLFAVPMLFRGRRRPSGYSAVTSGCKQALQRDHRYTVGLQNDDLLITDGEDPTFSGTEFDYSHLDNGYCPLPGEIEFDRCVRAVRGDVFGRVVDVVEVER